MGKKKRKKDPVRNQRFYHASTRRLRVGDLIYPSGVYARVGKKAPAVFLTNTPYVHYTLLSDDPEKYPVRFHLYEVKPEGKVYYDPLWDELVTFRPCRVVRLIKQIRFSHPPKEDLPELRQKGKAGKAWTRSSCLTFLIFMI